MANGIDVNNINQILAELGQVPLQDSSMSLGFAPTDTTDFTQIQNFGSTPDSPGDSKLLGNINTGLGVAGNLFKMYTGLKQLGLAEEQLDFNRSAFDTNLRNQARAINARLADRQARRVRDRPDQNLSVADYMAQFGVSENRNI